MAFKDIIYDQSGETPLVFFSSICISKTGPISCHTANEISLFRGGSGIYQINGTDYEFKSDDIFLIPGHVPHRIKHVESSVDFYNIYFEPRFIWDSNNFFDKEYLRVFKNSCGYSYKLDSDNPFYFDVLDLYTKIIAEYFQREKSYQHMIKGYLLTMLTLLYRHFNYGESEDLNISKRVIETMKKSMEYIDENYYKDITLSDIASSAHLSTTYYGVLFKKLNGISPWDYVISKRIKLAMDKISEGNYASLFELAKECGFSNTANFNKTFRKYTGVSPSQCTKDTKKPLLSQYQFEANVIPEISCDFYE